MDSEDWGGLLEALVDRLAARLAPVASLSDPIPAEVEFQGGSEPGVLLAATAGASGAQALVALKSGEVGWVPLTSVRLKYQPSGQLRLKLGWAEKGPPGMPAWTEGEAK